MAASCGVCPAVTWQFNFAHGLHEEGASGHGEFYTGCLSALVDQYNVWFGGTVASNVGETLVYPISAPSVVPGATLIANDVLIQNTVGGGPRGAAMVTGHLVNGIFTVDKITGVVTQLAPGMALNGGNMFLFRNTNANLGVGGTWTTQCGINGA